MSKLEKVSHRTTSYLLLSLQLALPFATDWVHRKLAI